MKRMVLLVVMVLTTATISFGQGEITGTRPGVDGQPLEITGTVFLLDVSKIDGAEQSFTADVFMLLQWRDERLATSTGGMRRMALDSIWNPRVQILNQRRIWKTFPDDVDVDLDGVVTYRQRYYGEFSSPLDLHDFPLDRHPFSLQFVVPGYSLEEIAFVPGGEGLGAGRSQEMTIPDWSIGAFEIRCEPFAIVPGGRRIAGLKGTFEARRHIGFYVGKAFVSVAIIVFMSWVVFWIGAEHLGPRLSVAVTSMLTLVAYRFLLGQSLPPVSYLTRLDYFLLGTTILVFVALMQVALTSAMSEGGRAGLAMTVNRTSRWLFPSVFAALVVVSFWLM